MLWRSPARQDRNRPSQKGGVVGCAHWGFGWRRTRSYFRPLDGIKTFGKLRFLMSEQFIIGEQAFREFEYPQREAAFFYGLFLRGHSAEELRRDIEVPPQVLARWHREAEREPSLREVLERMVEYRRHVLAIFDSLIGFDTRITRLQ